MKKRKKVKSKATKKKARAGATAAAKSMGVTFNKQGKVTNAATASKIAEGAAVSAAAAMGVNIMKSDGTVDTNKARSAISSVLGFSVEKDGNAQQSKAAKEIESAAVKMASSLNVNILDTNGNIDKVKVQEVAMLSLDLATANKIKQGRQEALNALNFSRDAMINATNQSRRELADVVTKLVSSSVLQDGSIDAQSALKIRETAITLTKADEFIQKRNRQQAAQSLSNNLSLKKLNS